MNEATILPTSTTLSETTYHSISVPYKFTNMQHRSSWVATILLTLTNLSETPYCFITENLKTLNHLKCNEWGCHSAHQNQLEWNHPPSFPGKCFHHRETTQTKKCLRALTNGDWKHFYNLFLPKTTSPTNFDRCESEAVMVTSLVLVRPLPLQLSYYCDHPAGPAKSPFPIFQSTQNL